MRLEPDIWIKLRPLTAPARLDEAVFSALRLQSRTLEEAGLEVVSGDESDWAHRRPQPDDWLDLPYEDVANASFTVVGVLVRRRSLRPVSHDRASPIALPERIEILTTAVRRWLQVGIAVGGGRDSVEVLFSDSESFASWAAQGEYTRRHPFGPFCPYPPREASDGDPAR